MCIIIVFSYFECKWMTKVFKQDSVEGCWRRDFIKPLEGAGSSGKQNGETDPVCMDAVWNPPGLLNSVKNSD